MAMADWKGTGIIIEDNAPKITFQAGNGEVSASEYETAPEIIVTVTDDKDNTISAGLASVTYKIGNGKEVGVQENFTESLKTEYSFNILKEQIPEGGAEIIVKATDNAGNSSEKKLKLTIHTAEPL